MQTLFGLFADPESTQRAVQAVEGMGINPEAIHVITPEPYHEFHFTSDAGEGQTSSYALAGGIIGGICGAALAAGTSISVNLPTGGMPIVSLAPVGIVTFALAGLGAVAGALFKTFRAAGMPDLKGRLYDDALYRDLADGGFLLAVECPREDWTPQIRQLLQEAGAGPVR